MVLAGTLPLGPNPARLAPAAAAPAMPDLDESTMFGQESDAVLVPWPAGYGSFTPASMRRRWPEAYGYLVGWPMVSANGHHLQRISPWPWPEGYGGQS